MPGKLRVSSNLWVYSGGLTVGQRIVRLGRCLRGHALSMTDRLVYGSTTYANYGGGSVRADVIRDLCWTCAAAGNRRTSQVVDSSVYRTVCTRMPSSVNTKVVFGIDLQGAPRRGGTRHQLRIAGDHMAEGFVDELHGVSRDRYARGFDVLGHLLRPGRADQRRRDVVVL